MARFTVDEAAIASLPGLPSVDDAVARVADAIFADSQILVPVRTGRLKESGHVDGGHSEYTIGYTEDYDGYVEFGTRYMNAEPYLRPAALKYRRSV